MISAILKERTQKLHDEVEDRVHASKIFEGTYTPADYQLLLELHHDFLAQYEEPIFGAFGPATAASLELPRRRKLPILQADMKHLGVVLNRDQTVAPITLSAAEAFGFLYVIEGATLGGNVIAKQLAKHSEFNGMPMGYLRCYGENTGPLWHQFQRVLDTEVGEAHYDSVVRGAERAYYAMLDDLGRRRKTDSAMARL